MHGAAKPHSAPMDLERPFAIPGGPSISDSKASDSGLAPSQTLQPIQLCHGQSSATSSSQAPGGQPGHNDTQVSHPASKFCIFWCQSMGRACLLSLINTSIISAFHAGCHMCLHDVWCLAFMPLTQLMAHPCSCRSKLRLSACPAAGCWCIRPDLACV